MADVPRQPLRRLQLHGRARRRQGTGEGDIVGGFSDVSGLGNEVKYSEYRNGNEKVNTSARSPTRSSTTTSRSSAASIGDRRPVRLAQERARGRLPTRAPSRSRCSTRRATPVCQLGAAATRSRRSGSGPTLAAKGGGEVAMEELHLVHEGIDYESMTAAPAVALALGAPGVYRRPARARPRARPACGWTSPRFVGVAPRGPAREPVVDEPGRRGWSTGGRVAVGAVAVESWDEYRGRSAASRARAGCRTRSRRSSPRAAGGPASCGSCTTAPAARRAAAPPARAPPRRPLGAAVDAARPRDEGAWGNAAAARRCASTPRGRCAADRARGRRRARAAGRRSASPAGALLRLALAGGTPRAARSSPRVERTRPPRRRAGARAASRRSTAPLPARAGRAVEVVDGARSTSTTATRRPRASASTGLGLRAGHPRWLADVLRDESRAASRPVADVGRDRRCCPPTPTLPPAATADAASAAARTATPRSSPDDFFDDALGRSATSDAPRRRRRTRSLERRRGRRCSCVPDLYAPAPLEPPSRDRRPPAAAPAPTFEPLPDAGRRRRRPRRRRRSTGCASTRATRRPRPRSSRRQRRLVDARRALRAVRRAARRAARAAPPRDRSLAGAVRLARTPPPTTRGCGVARPRRPARRAASRAARRRSPPASSPRASCARACRAGRPTSSPRGVVDVERPRRRRRAHDELHQLGDQRLPRRARRRPADRRPHALAATRDWRQLSVRRLMTHAGASLRAPDCSGRCSSRTTAALRGAAAPRARRAACASCTRAARSPARTEEEAFFVRCDDALNPPAVVDAGPAGRRGRRRAGRAAGVPRAAHRRATATAALRRWRARRG